MRRFLLALPLFLVIGLAFIELPVNASSNPNQSTVSVTASPSASPEPSAPSVSQSIQPIAPLPQSNLEGKKRGPRHGGFEEHEDQDHEDDDFEDDDD